MSTLTNNKPSRLQGFTKSHRFAALVLAGLVVLGGAVAARGQNGSWFFLPGNLVVSRSVYDNNSKNVQVGDTLPPNCTTGCGVAVNDGTYPTVWNNDLADASFG